MTIFAIHHSEENFASLSLQRKNNRFIGHRSLPSEHTAGISNSKSFIIKGKAVLGSFKTFKLVLHASDGKTIPRIELAFITIVLMCI